jgi:hypothetical protein
MKYLGISLKWKPVEPEAEFLDKIQTNKVAIHSHLYSFAVRFSASSNSCNLLQFLQFSSVRRKT